ncbi:MAG: hypothetical protein IKO67_06470 [Bacteroidaceae bacterium]|nr:hypothetical protein [Bacteroidaceae bacterium]
MTKSEKKHWEAYKERWKKTRRGTKLDADIAISNAYKAAEEFGYQKGKAETALKFLYDTMESVNDDYYRLLENPCYVWKDGEEDAD